jgi:general secretion pathway protein M
MTHLTPNQSRAAALALLGLAGLLLLSLFAVPLWLLNQHYDLALETATSQMERYTRIVGMREGLQKKADEVKALAQTHHFLKSASPPIAAAELQEQAKTLLEANGAKLNSMQVLAHKDDGPYRQVSVNLQLAAPKNAIKAILYALESAKPYLFVDNLSIRTQTIFVPKSDPDLIVQFDLTGYALKGTP